MPELPINILVIVAIAVIILLSIVALYFVGWSPFGGFVSLASLKNQGCSNYSFNYECGARGAATSDIEFQTNSYKVNNLLELCQNYLNASTESECRASCGCGATISSGGGGGGPCTCGATSCGSCISDNPPKFCNSAGTIVDNCIQCPPCPLASPTCNADGSCSAAVCSCNWENDACGGGGCTIFVFWCGQWQRCKCSILNCGTCGGSPDGALFCNTGIVCGVVGISC